jgi:hypothetical protein
MHRRNQRPAKNRHQRDQLSYADIAIYAVMAFAGVWFLYPEVEVMLMSAEERAAIENSVTYSGCGEASAAGAAPLHRGEPGYRDYFDGDGDGIACERWG